MQTTHQEWSEIAIRQVLSKIRIAHEFVMDKEYFHVPADSVCWKTCNAYFCYKVWVHWALYTGWGLDMGQMWGLEAKGSDWENTHQNGVKAKCMVHVKPRVQCNVKPSVWCNVKPSVLCNVKPSVKVTSESLCEPPVRLHREDLKTARCLMEGCTNGTLTFLAQR